MATASPLVRVVVWVLAGKPEVRDALAVEARRGVTIVSARAGETIQEWIYVLSGDLSARAITTAIHVYPTYSKMNVWAGGRLLEQQLRGGIVGNVVNVLSDLSLRFMRWRHGV